MADSIDVLLTLGYDAAIPKALHEYLTSPIPGIQTQNGSQSGQHLTCISSNELYPHDYPGSGQAGALRVYAACLRRGYPSTVVDFLKSAPWKYQTAVLVIDGHDDGPLVMQIPG